MASSLLFRSACHLLNVAQCCPHGLPRTALVRSLASVPSSDDHQSDIALFNRIVEGLPSAATASSSGSDSAGRTGRTDDVPQRTATAHDNKDVEPHMALLNDDYGYAVLGGVDPEDASSDWGKGTPRVHPQRLFSPGETYNPEDLNPFYKAAPMTRQNNLRKNITRWSEEELYEQADFKNIPFLEQFVSNAGRLLPQKKTKLKAAHHRHVMRQVKIARAMALMPHETRIGDDQRKRLRQFEILQTQQRQALQAEASNSLLENVTS